MKSINYIAAGIIGATFLFSCEKNTKPTIEIIGDNPYNIELNDFYDDPGAKAEDNEGTLEVTTNSSEVNPFIVGSYEVSYTATNDLGTAVATRTVNVNLSQDNWTGTYAVSHDCPTALPLNADGEVVAGATTSDLVFNNVLTLVGGTLNATISGTTITIPEQIIDITVGQVTISGTGIMNGTGDSMIITYTYDNNTPFVGDSGTCTATYSK